MYASPMDRESVGNVTMKVHCTTDIQKLRNLLSSLYLTDKPAILLLFSIYQRYCNRCINIVK